MKLLEHGGQLLLKTFRTHNRKQDRILQNKGTSSKSEHLQHFLEFLQFLYFLFKPVWRCLALALHDSIYSSQWKSLKNFALTKWSYVHREVYSWGNSMTMKNKVWLTGKITVQTFKHILIMARYVKIPCPLSFKRWWTYCGQRGELFSDGCVHALSRHTLQHKSTFTGEALVGFFHPLVWFQIIFPLSPIQSCDNYNKCT